MDRNFALDYTLKSLEKILDGEARRRVRAARVVLKDAAYIVLGGMIEAAGQAPATRLPGAYEALELRIGRLLDGEVEVLRERMVRTVEDVAGPLPARHAQTLRYEHDRWAAAGTWRLINAADPCGT